MVVAANPNGSGTERNIADCLDRTFAKALESEFDRITADISPAQISGWLRRSRQSIDRRRNSGNPPDYSDPMVELRCVIRH